MLGAIRRHSGVLNNPEGYCTVLNACSRQVLTDGVLWSMNKRAGVFEVGFMIRVVIGF